MTTMTTTAATLAAMTTMAALAAAVRGLGAGQPRGEARRDGAALGDEATAWEADAAHGATLRAARAGRLQSLRGQAWVTLEGEPDDWVIGAGEGVELPAGARVHVGPWRDGHAPRLAWRPAATRAA